MVKLPQHLQKLFDTPAKRKRINAIFSKARKDQIKRMRKKGFVLKKGTNIFVKRKR